MRYYYVLARGQHHYFRVTFNFAYLIYFFAENDVIYVNFVKYMFVGCSAFMFGFCEAGLADVSSNGCFSRWNLSNNCSL